MKKNLMVKDINGNILKVSENDPRYISKELIPIATGRVSVKDYKGNTLSVDINDPRYISGELIHVSTKNEIYVKYNKKIFICEKNHPNILNNKYKVLENQRKLKYRHIDTGNINYFFPEDENINFNEYQFFNKLELTVRDKNGKIFNVFKKDKRYLSGELIPIATKYIYNCKIHGIQRNVPEYKRLKQKPIPEEYKIYCPECKKFYFQFKKV